jgi:RNA polymerase sigma factor (sigma-70 family)
MATSPLSKVLQQLRRGLLARDAAGLSDGQLLECFLVGRDEAAFEALVRRHGPMVLGVCRRVTGHAQDAEDAFQAAFLVLARKAASVRPRELVGNWLYGVACRTALKAKAASARRRAKERQVPQMPEPRVPPQAVCHELVPLLDAELERLPEKYRVPVVLCELQGRSRKDVARQLNLPEGTLSSRLATARQMLAGRLSRHGVPVSAGVLTAVFAQQTAPAGVSPVLISSTVKAATLAAAGQAVTAGLISSRVAALTEGVLKAMLLSNLKSATVLVLTLWALAFVTGVPPLGDVFTRPTNARPTSPIRTARGDATMNHAPADDPGRLVGSGKPETKKFEVADFTSLDVFGAFEVEVTKADKFSVSVTADDNLLEYIKVVKNGSTLRISFAEGKSLKPKTPFRATITMPVLKGVTLSGACHSTLEGFESNEDLEVKLTGASTLAGTVKAKAVKLEATGASKVTLKGSAQEATLSGSGASEFLLADFPLDSAKVHLVGACTAVVHAKSKLDYTLSGASHLKYQGKPTLGEKKTSGASSAKSQ